MYLDQGLSRMWDWMDYVLKMNGHFFQTQFIEPLAALYGSESEAYKQAILDPSSDNYHYFRGSDYDKDEKYSSILERYKNFNGPDGNSPTEDINPESYPTAATTRPDAEDITATTH